MLEAGGLEEYSEKHSNLKITDLYQSMYRKITAQAISDVSNPNLELYVDKNALARYQYDLSNNRHFKEAIFSTNQRIDNQKIKYFKADDALTPKLI